MQQEENKEEHFTVAVRVRPFQSREIEGHFETG